MTEKERFVVAADVLSASCGQDGADTLPLDSLITTFKGDVDQAGSAGATADSAIVEIGAVIYLTGWDQYRP